MCQFGNKMLLRDELYVYIYIYIYKFCQFAICFEKIAGYVCLLYEVRI